MATVVYPQQSQLGTAFIQGVGIGQRQQRINLAKDRLDLMIGQEIDDPKLIREVIARRKGVDVDEVDLSLSRSLAPLAPDQTPFQRKLAKGHLANQQIIKDKFINYINADRKLAKQITSEVNRKSGRSTDARERLKVFDDIINNRIEERGNSASFRKFATKEFGSLSEFSRQSRVFHDASALQNRVNRFNADPDNQIDVTKASPAQLNPLILKDLHREVDAIKSSGMTPGEKVSKILQKVRLSNEDMRRSDDVFKNRTKRLNPREFLIGVGGGATGKGKKTERVNLIMDKETFGNIVVGKNKDLSDPSVVNRLWKNNSKIKAKWGTKRVFENAIADNRVSFFKKDREDFIKDEISRKALSDYEKGELEEITEIIKRNKRPFVFRKTELKNINRELANRGYKKRVILDLDEEFVVVNKRRIK